LHISGEFTAPEEGESPVFMDNRELTLIIEDEGEEIYQDLPFPGFTMNLVGLSAGENSSVIYRFPEDSAVKYMAGKEVAYTFTADQVNSRTLPEINDELAQSIGDYATMEVLRKAILDDLQKEADETYNEDYDQKVLDQLVEMSTIEYPPQMLDREIDVVLDQLVSRLQQQGLDMDLYLKTRSMTAEQLREETKPVAETRLKRSLVLFEVAEKEDIEVDPQQLQNETLRTMDLYSRMMPAKDFKRLTTKEATNNLVGNIMMELVIEKTKERLRNFAQGIEVETVSSEDESEAEAVENVEPVIAAQEINLTDADSGSLL
jgi:trigger factor